jgi:MFS family permease
MSFAERHKSKDIPSLTEDVIQRIQRKTIRTLTAGQVLSGFGLGSTLSIGALLAEELSGTAAWSGAAATFSTLGAATWAIPLARLANARGRRRALASGAGLAITGALLVITAAATRTFPLLLIALFLLGAGSATGLQARFAAVDLPSPKHQGRDLSVVVWATTVGAVIGPNLFGPGEVVGRALGLPHLTGPFVFTILAQTLATTVLWFGLRPDPLLLAQQIDAAKSSSKPKASLKQAVAILRAKPIAAFAVSTIALSHMVMVAVMSMTPVHLEHHGATLTIVGFTISMHIAGMYAFSPIFGALSDKFGRIRIVVLGQITYVFALAIAGWGSQNIALVQVGLFLLGLGWSASTVAGSSLLAANLSTNEKANVQGLSDSLMNLSGAFGGATSGTILALFAFSGLNAAAFIPVSVTMIAAAVTHFGKRSR